MTDRPSGTATDPRTPETAGVQLSATEVDDTPIFLRDDGRYVATDLARGPWDPGACHGGAPAALLAAAVEVSPTLTAMQVVRLTYDLQRPVPVDKPLDLEVEISREGKRIQTVNAALLHDGLELVRCRALKIRTTALHLPEDRPQPIPPPTPPPHDLPRFVGHPGEEPIGFWRAVDVRFVQGSLGEPGDGVAWFKVISPLSDGLPLTPLARAAAASDFGNGIGSPLPTGSHRYINPDLTVALHRLPVTDWVASRASSVADEHGIGLSTAHLADEHGGIGTAVQTLYIDEGTRSR